MDTEQKIQNVEQCLIRLTVLAEQMQKEEEDHESRIRALELKPAKTWDGVKTIVLSSALSLCVSVLASVLIGILGG